MGPQPDQASENLEVALKEAGGKGWSQLYAIRAYLAPLDLEGARRTS
jgi:hypothetical protein